MESYGEKIRRIRGSWGKKEFAQALGITVQALNAYESGQRLPRDEVRTRLKAVAGGAYFFAKEVHK